MEGALLSDVLYPRSGPASSFSKESLRFSKESLRLFRSRGPALSDGPSLPAPSLVRVELFFFLYFCAAPTPHPPLFPRLPSRSLGPHGAEPTRSSCGATPASSSGTPATTLFRSGPRCVATRPEPPP